jgi:hypothetical protein
MLLTEVLDINSQLEKLMLVIYGLLLSPSTINISMDLQIDTARQKQIYPLYSVSISIDKYNISPTEYLL